MIKKIWQFYWPSIKPYKWHLLLMLQAPVVGAFFMPVYNYAVKLIIDNLTSHRDISISLLIIPISIFIVAHIVLELAWRISNYADYKSQPQIEIDITARAYDYILNHSYHFFQNNLSGRIAKKIVALQEGYVNILDCFHFRVINGVITIFVTLGFLFFVNPILSAALFGWCILFLPIMFVMSIKSIIFSENYTNEKQKSFGFIVDGISNISSLFFFAAKKKETFLVNKKLNQVKECDRIRLKYIFYLHLLMAFIYTFLSISILFLLIHLRKKGLITIGDFAMVFGLMFYIIDVTFHMIGESQNLIRYFGEIKESFSIFDEKYQVIQSKNAKKLKIKKGEIEFQNISFKHEEVKQVFNKLNLIIKAGEKVGLVGHSGAGKSTLINILLKFFQINSGKILIDGKNISNITNDSLRENIAVIPQDTALFHRSLMENIRYGKNDASDADVIAASKKAHIHEYILGLPEKYNTLVGERGVKLSGGQRQRIAIARAILKDSPILILDEATSALDSGTEKDIQESLELLIKDQNKTVIAIAHRLSTLKNMDRIIVLDQGKIIEEGTHFELIANEKSLYYKLWKLQEI